MARVSILLTVVLPLPLSPTSPRHSPRRIVKLDIVDRPDDPGLAAEHRRLPEVVDLAEIGNGEQRPVVRLGALHLALLHLDHVALAAAKRDKPLVGRHVEMRSGVEQRAQIVVAAAP